MRTPDIPGRSTAHPLRLVGLHALQEVVLLLLLAGLLRPVEEVVLGDGDLGVVWDKLGHSLHDMTNSSALTDTRNNPEYFTINTALTGTRIIITSWITES